MIVVRRLVFRLVLLALFAAPPIATAGLFSAVYVIGDSLSDQGNLLNATVAAPDPAHYFQGRFSNGPVYTDILTQTLLARNELQTPLGISSTGGNNFSYGGARTNYNAAEMQAGGPFPNGFRPWTLTTEVAAFQARGVNDPNGLYIVFSGANDVADIARGLQPPSLINATVLKILDAVNAFIVAGAQTIIVPNLPDLGSTPLFRGTLGETPARNLSALFNQTLATALNAVVGPKIIQFQTDDLFQDVISNPGKYGFTNVTQPCYTGFVNPVPAGTECATPDDFAFWDLVHPTTETQRFLANAILATIPQPSTLWLGAACLLVLAWSSRRAVARTAARRMQLRVS